MENAFSRKFSGLGYASACMFICRFVCLPLDARSCGCLQIYIYIQFGNSLIAKTNPPSSGLMTVYNFFPTQITPPLSCLILPCHDIAPRPGFFQTGSALALLMSRVRTADDVEVSAMALVGLSPYDLNNQEQSRKMSAIAHS